MIVQGSGKTVEFRLRWRYRHLKVQVDVVARELYFQVFRMHLISDQRYLDDDAMVLHIIFDSHLLSTVVWSTRSYFENCYITVFQGSDLFSRPSFPKNANQEILAIRFMVFSVGGWGHSFPDFCEKGIDFSGV